MPKTLFWIQAGGCGGDSMALLSIEWPNIFELMRLGNIDTIWHPSFSDRTPKAYAALVEDIIVGRQPLDILCVEGAVLLGPNATGQYDPHGESAKKDVIRELAFKAVDVVAVGTCASFGGICGSNVRLGATGLQFRKEKIGGFLGKSFRSKSAKPVVNLPGCPCHPNALAGTIAALAMDWELPLTNLNSPAQYYDVLVHQGCMRNEFHEYRVEETDFGKKGCLFFHLGCRGPLCHGPCNKFLWNGRSSKTSVGVPCFGCTHPSFPQDYPFFKTRNIAGIPKELPEGVDRAHYMAYKGMAAAAAPERLKNK